MYNTTAYNTGNKIIKKYNAIKFSCKMFNIPTRNLNRTPLVVDSPRVSSHLFLILILELSEVTGWYRSLFITPQQCPPLFSKTLRSFSLKRAFIFVLKSLKRTTAKHYWYSY